VKSLPAQSGKNFSNILDAKKKKDIAHDSDITCQREGEKPKEGPAGEKRSNLGRTLRKHIADRACTRGSALALAKRGKKELTREKGEEEGVNLSRCLEGKPCPFRLRREKQRKRRHVRRKRWSIPERGRFFHCMAKNEKKGRNQSKGGRSSGHRKVVIAIRAALQPPGREAQRKEKRGRQSFIARKDDPLSAKGEAIHSAFHQAREKDLRKKRGGGHFLLSTRPPQKERNLLFILFGGGKNNNG